MTISPYSLRLEMTNIIDTFVSFQNIDVTKQAEVDKIMLELDGTENKC